MSDLWDDTSWDELETLITFPLPPEERAAFLEAVSRPLIDPIDLRPFLRPEDMRRLRTSSGDKIDATKPVFDLTPYIEFEEER